MFRSALFIFALFFLSYSPLWAWDSDDDGIPNKYDLCKKEPEDKDNFEDTDGCPDVDNDKDGVCDPWVATQGKSSKYAATCKGSDKCENIPEDKDGFEDEDGCPDLDNDKDGIPDLKDKCPDQPEDFDGFEDSDGCPDLDNDKDGIPDSQDKCPMAAEDKDGIQDDDGCPELDGDGDGIKDEVDKCPMEPETINGRDDDDGCPDVAFDAPETETSFKTVGFRTGTTDLMVEGLGSLERYAEKLAAYPNKVTEIRVFSLVRGNRDEYFALLQSQSQALVDYFISKGVKPEQLKQLEYNQTLLDTSKGSSDDLNQNRTPIFRLVE